MSDVFDIYMYVVAVLGNFFLYFQAFQLWKIRSRLNFQEAGSVSRYISYLIPLWVAISWLVYAYTYNNQPLKISSTVALVGTVGCLSILTTYSWDRRGEVTEESRV